MKFFTLIVLVLNMFLKKLKYLLDLKSSKQTYLEKQADSSIMHGYFCIGFIDFMFPGKSLIDCASLFSSYDFKKNDDIILSYFK